MLPTELLRIGILGGQGPFASAEFQARLLRAFAQLPDAVEKADAGFPQVLHLSAALPGLGVAGVAHGAPALAVLRSRLSFLLPWKPHVVAIPCNSLHAQATALQKQAGAVSVLCPWLSAQAYLADARVPHLVLGSASLRTQLQAFAGGTNGWAPYVVLPDEDGAGIVDEIIQAAAQGREGFATVLFEQELGPWIRQWVQARRALQLEQVAARSAPESDAAEFEPRVLLACTELSLLDSGDTWANTVVTTVDSMDLLVHDAVQILQFIKHNTTAE